MAPTNITPVAVVCLILGNQLLAPTTPTLGQDEKPASAKSPQEEKGWKIRVRAVAQNGKPLVNPRFGVQLRSHTEPVTWHDGDTEGNCELTLANKLPSYCNLFVRASGYAPMRAFWWNHKDRPEDALPAEFTFEMTRAITIGGFVVDEEENPVKGATVTISAGDHKSNPGRRAQSSFNGEKVLTDESGKWVCELPPQTMTSASVDFAHPEFASDTTNDSLQSKLLDLLRDRQHVWTLKKGFSVEGRIVDEKGKSIEGATLAICRLNTWVDLPPTKTDADGRYRFKHILPPDPQDGNPQIIENEIAMTVTAYKPGFAPAMEKIPGFGKRPLDKSTETERFVDFNLKPGVTISLRIVDSKGEPIKKAWVIPKHWRNTMVLMYLRNEGIPELADEKGVWQWKDAPLGEEITFDIAPKGFARKQDHPVFADGGGVEEAIELKRPQIILGAVVDSKTKKPIKEFVLERAFEGMAGHPDGLFWTSDGIRGKDGKYRGEITMPPSNGSYTYRILADGYEPAVSESTPFTEGETTIDFELQPKSKK